MSLPSDVEFLSPVANGQFLGLCYYSVPWVIYIVKAVPLQAWSGPEGSRKLKLQDFVTTAQDGGKVVSLTHRPPLPPGNAPGTHFYSRLSRPHGHSAIGRILYEWKIHWQQLRSNQRPSDLQHSTLTTELPRSLYIYIVESHFTTRLRSRIFGCKPNHLSGLNWEVGSWAKQVSQIIW